MLLQCATNLWTQVFKITFFLFFSGIILDTQYLIIWMQICQDLDIQPLLLMEVWSFMVVSMVCWKMIPLFIHLVDVKCLKKNLNVWKLKLESNVLGIPKKLLVNNILLIGKNINYTFWFYWRYQCQYLHTF